MCGINKNDALTEKKIQNTSETIVLLLLKYLML